MYKSVVVDTRKKYVLDRWQCCLRDYVPFVVKFSFHFNSIFILCAIDFGE